MHYNEYFVDITQIDGPFGAGTHKSTVANATLVIAKERRRIS